MPQPYRPQSLEVLRGRLRDALKESWDAPSGVVKLRQVCENPENVFDFESGLRLTIARCNYLASGKSHGEYMTVWASIGPGLLNRTLAAEAERRGIKVAEVLSSMVPGQVNEICPVSVAFIRFSPMNVPQFVGELPWSQSTEAAA